MKPIIFAAALSCAAAFSGTVAQAQWIGPGWSLNIEFTAQDLGIIRSTLQRDIHGRPPSTVATWSNPASGHSGTITLLRTFTQRNMPCEQIEYQMMTSHPGERPERYVFNSCRLPDGSWKLAG